MDLRRFPLHGLVVLIACGLSCVITTDESRGELTMSRADALGDTVSVFPLIKVAFSVPLADLSLDVTVTPPIATEHSIWMNKTRDTLMLNVAGMLEGATRYVIRIDGPVVTEHGQEYNPFRDSVVFVTYPSESRQNQSPSLADTLDSRVFGVVQISGVVDYFFPRNQQVERLFVQAHSQKVRLTAGTPGTSDTVSVVSESGPDTLVIPSSMSRPFYAWVSSEVLESMQRYEIGVLDE